jgi:cation/acetate symporter
VAAAFSLAGAAFVPVLLLGVFWRRANAWGAIAGMLVGLGVTAWYMVSAHPGLRASLGLSGPPLLWWGIQPISAGVFGVPASLAAAVLVSLLTPRAASGALMVAELRQPPPG